MKLILLTFVLSLGLGLRAWGHGGAPLGPNGGRLLEFSKDHSVQGELTLTNGTFRLTLLDAQKKPIALNDQVLAVAGGDRNQPTKPVVTRDGNQFVFPALAGKKYPLVFQFRATADARPVTARMTFDSSTCSGCNHPEWLCRCDEEEHDHDEKKPAAK